MKIKQISLEKSRTIRVEGLMSRDFYRKIVVGMIAEVDCMTEGQLAEEREALSKAVDESIKFEADKIKKEIKSKN